MLSPALVLLGAVAATLLLLAPLLGRYMARVFTYSLPATPLAGLENFCLRAIGISPTTQHSARDYIRLIILWHVIGLLWVIALVMIQPLTPFNPAGLPAPSWHLAFNIAASFITNTNWQSYAGEFILSPFTQMVALGTQNFLSATLALVAAIAFIRGFASTQTKYLGNFYHDALRALLYILLPLCLLTAPIWLQQGTPQNFAAPITTVTEQTIITGPVASQMAIKQLGSNGGGYYSANSAHPFENPTLITNFLSLLAMLLVPAALLFTYGHMVGDIKQGRTLFIAMGVLSLAGIGLVLWAESHAPLAGLWLGRDIRLGDSSALWTAITSASGNGSINTLIESQMPLTIAVALFQMLVGGVAFGGIGCGLLAIMVYIFLTLFIAGLMIGRTPHYLGKKIEQREMKYLMLVIIGLPFLVLTGTILSLIYQPITPDADGVRSFARILYSFASSVGNNGSALSGFDANTPYWNTLLGIGMLAGRLITILPMLAIAGSMAAKQNSPDTTHHFPTTSPLFVVLLIVIVVVMGGLTYMPSIMVGPVLEHLNTIQRM